MLNVPIPSVPEYKSAFSTIKDEITPKQMMLLKCLVASPSYSKTASQLAHYADYQNYRGTNLQMGLLGKHLRIALNYWEVPGLELYVLCNLIRPETQLDDWILTMHDEVAKALKELGWFAG